MGTLIIEGWTQSKTICTQMLSSLDMAERVASKLVEIANQYHFDGWLINIECEVEPNKVETLVSLMKVLTEMMHSKVPQRYFYTIYVLSKFYIISEAYSYCM